MASVWPILTWITGTAVSKDTIKNNFRDYVPVCVATVAEMRALTTLGTRNATIDGVTYVYDSADTTTADDGNSCIVTSDGQRYKKRGGTATVADNSITNAKLATVPANTIKGNNTGATANATDMTVAQARTLLGLVTIATSGSASDLSTGTVPAAAMPAHTGDVTSSAGSVALTVAANAITNAKAAQMAANTIKGNNTGATANATDMTVAQLKTLLAYGTAAALDVGTTANKVVQLDASARLPAVDGSLLTGISGGSSGLTLLTSGTVSAAATLDIVMTSYTAYTGVMLIVDLIPATDAQALYMRFSTNGGSTYDASGYNYAGQGIDDSGSSAGFGSGSANQIQLSSATGVGNLSNEGIVSHVKIMSQASAALWSKCIFHSYTINSAATPAGVVHIGGGAREAVQDTDALRIFFASGNIASGKWALYGLA